MLWAYMLFSQFLLIWVGNLPEEIPWYLRRPGRLAMGGVCLVVFHFAFPSCCCSSAMSRGTRGAADGGRGGARHALRACSGGSSRPYPHEGQYFFWLLDLAAVVGMGGV